MRTSSARTGSGAADGGRHERGSVGGAPTEQLDARKAAILQAVVSEYIETAQPVGSAHVAQVSGIEVSSATIRSEMAALEREGFLVQPHTSAGRIPTDKGYRFFVDHLGADGRLDEHQRTQVRQFFAHVHGEVEELLARTSGLLSSLTDYATVVVGPTHETAPVVSVQLVPLAATVVLVLVVLQDGAVEKRTVDLAMPCGDEAVARAAAVVGGAVAGRSLADAQVPTAPTGDVEVDAVVRAAGEAIAEMRSAEPEQVFVGGSSKVAAAFDAVETVRTVLAILEQQLVVVELVEEVLDRGLSVAIGTEHGFEPLASCALVVAPVTVDGETAGTVGVLGPTRMHYPRALAAVELVGRELGERLGRRAGE
jgi:heat-inducible transcriptional repressor